MFKKSVVFLGLVFLIMGIFIPFSDYTTPVYAQENLMMHESQNDDVKEEINDMNTSINYIDDLGDFSANYVKDTYFAIAINGKIFYNQGYYITVNEDGKVVFCIEPDVMIGTIESNTLSEGKYNELSDNQKANIKDIVESGLKAYKESKDELYLIATQIRVWQEVGAEVLDLSDNVLVKEKELEDLQSTLEQNLNSNYESTPQGTSTSISNDNSSSILDTQTYENNSDISSDNDYSKDEVVLKDSQSYDTQVEQYVTKGQDVVTISEDVGFEVTTQVSDEDSDDVVYPEELLTYDVSITNNMEDTEDFLVQESDYNKYLSTTKNDTLNVKGKTYNVEDLISSNFVIEGVDSGQTVEFSFEVQADENYDGEIIDNEIEVCNTSDNGCVSSKTRIMGNAVSEELEEQKQNPYAKINEENVTEDKIEVKVTGADISSLMQGEADVNLYLGENVIATESIDLSDEEDTYAIIFKDSDNYDIISNTKYTIKVEGKYEDYTTGQVVEGVLTDGSAQNTKAELTVETEKSDNEPEVGNIKVSSTLKELTANSVKAEISIDNPYEDEIDTGEIVFEEEEGSSKETLELSNENIDKLMDGDNVTVEKTELKANTKYEVSYKFYDNSDKTLASGSLGEITTDTNTPSFTLANDTFEVATSKISGTINISNKEAIMNLNESKTKVVLTEYNSSLGVVGTPQEQEVSIDDTTDSIIYDFTQTITTGNIYEISITGKYNVDNMFDQDAEEGSYTTVLKSYDGDGNPVYQNLTAIYDTAGATIGSSSIDVGFEIQNPNSETLTNLTTKVCKTSDTTSCPDYTTPVLDPVTNKYTVSLGGLESNTEYRLISTWENGGVVEEIPGITDIFNTNAATASEPPKAEYSNIKTTPGNPPKTVTADLKITDNDNVTTGDPIVYVYTDENGDGHINGSDAQVGEITPVQVQPKFLHEGEYTIELSGLDSKTDYQFQTVGEYTSGGEHPITCEDGSNIFSTGGLFGTRIEYNLETTEEYENSIVTEFTLIDEDKKANAIGEVSVYTDVNHNGEVDDADEKVDTNVIVTPINGLTYKVEVDNLEPNTFYQLHNDIASGEDNKVYEVPCENNVFKTKEKEDKLESTYNLYVEPINNSIDSYSQNMAGIEVSVLSTMLDEIESIDIKFVNKYDILDDEVITLTNKQLDEIKKGNSIDLYMNDLSIASEYIVYAVINAKDSTEIIEATDDIYTDYKAPEIYITSKEETENGFETTFEVGDNTLIQDISLINETEQKTYDVDYEDNIGRVKVDNLEPNTNYDFSLEYNYMIDNESYLSATTYTAKISYSIETKIDQRQEINTCQELQDIQGNLVGNYYLNDNIDCSGYEFEPISGFSGTLDGNDKEISNLTIDKENTDNVGLISSNSGIVSNIIFNNLEIVGNSNVGLVGTNFGTIEDIRIRGGSISGSSYIGSQAGTNLGIIQNTSSNITLNGEDYIGAIAADNSGNLQGNVYTGEILSLGEHVNDISQDEINSEHISENDTKEIEDNDITNNTNEDYISKILGIDAADDKIDKSEKEEAVADDKIDKSEKEEAVADDASEDTGTFNLYDYIKGLVEN